MRLTLKKKKQQQQLLSSHCILLHARVGEGEEDLGIELDRLGLGRESGLGIDLGLGLG